MPSNYSSMDNGKSLKQMNAFLAVAVRLSMLNLIHRKYGLCCLRNVGLKTLEAIERFNQAAQRRASWL